MLPRKADVVFLLLSMAISSTCIRTLPFRPSQDLRVQLPLSSVHETLAFSHAQAFPLQRHQNQITDLNPSSSIYCCLSPALHSQQPQKTCHTCVFTCLPRTYSQLPPLPAFQSYHSTKTALSTVTSDLHMTQPNQWLSVPPCLICQQHADAHFLQPEALSSPL